MGEGGEREKHQCERNVHQLPPVHALTRDQTCNLLVYGTTLQPTEPTLYTLKGSQSDCLKCKSDNVIPGVKLQRFSITLMITFKHILMNFTALDDPSASPATLPAAAVLNSLQLCWPGLHPCNIPRSFPPPDFWISSSVWNVLPLTPCGDIP